MEILFIILSIFIFKKFVDILFPNVAFFFFFAVLIYLFVILYYHFSRI